MSSIAGVKIKPLTVIADERGKVMHMLKATDPDFVKFGEIYFTCAWPGSVKGWHMHRTMTINLAVVSGLAKFCCYSTERDILETYFMGEDTYSLLTIPPEVWSGFLPYGNKMTVVANCATEPYDISKNEIVYWDSFELPTKRTEFVWSYPYG